MSAKSIVNPFGERSIERIVTATGLPPRVDPKALQELLAECYRHWVLMNYFGHRAATKHVERLTKIRKWAAQGEGLLRDDPLVTIIDPSMLPHVKLFDWKLGNLNLNFEKLPGSPLSLLTGVYLPAVFKECFKRKPASSRNADTGKVGGPYIRFAVQVCVEFGFTCPAETIAGALRQHRAKSLKK